MLFMYKNIYTIHLERETMYTYIYIERAPPLDVKKQITVNMLQQW